MKKHVLLRVISVVLGLLALLSMVCAATVTGGGFLDLSNIARAVLMAIAVVCAVPAILLWNRGKR